MSAAVKRSRESEECTCGCFQTSIWDCYNSSPELLKQELKRTKISKKISQAAHAYGLIAVQNGDEWIVEHEAPEMLAMHLCNSLKEKVGDTLIQSALNMLEDCKVEEIPIRAVYILNQLTPF